MIPRTRSNARRAQGRGLLLLWGVWWALGVVGCGLDAPEGADPPPQNRCSASADCPAGSRCQPEAGLCVGPLRRAYRLGLVVSPGSDRLGELPEQYVGPLVVDQLEVRRDVLLQRPLAVVGDVTAKDAATGAVQHVPAELRFVAPPPWPGSAAVAYTASTASTPMETNAGPVDYRVRLRAGGRYDVIVRPTGEAAERFPPLRFEGVRVPAEGDLWRLDVTYGLGEEGGLHATWPPRVLRLRLAYEDAATGGYEPLEGIQVRLVEAISERTVSTVARSDERGQVTLGLSPDAGDDVLLRISAGEERPLFPTLTVPPTLLHPGEVPLLLLPRPRPVRYLGRVEVAGRGEPVAEATLSFESDSVFDPETGLQGSFRATVDTASSSEERGGFDVVLLPGRYEVRIVPVDPSLAVAVYDLDVLPLGEDEGSPRTLDPSAPPLCGRTARCGRIFEVSERGHLTGRLVAWHGVPFPGVLVEGRARGLPLPDETPALAAAPYNRPSSSVSDGTGRFSLPLDVGYYDVRIVPPAESRWAPILWRDLPARGGTMRLEETQTLPAPILLSGAVLDGDGGPWAGATVRAYLLLEDGETFRPLFVAQGSSDESGRYELLLPGGPPDALSVAGDGSPEPVAAP